MAIGNTREFSTNDIFIGDSDTFLGLCVLSKKSDNLSLLPLAHIDVTETIDSTYRITGELYLNGPDKSKLRPGELGVWMYNAVENINNPSRPFIQTIYKNLSPIRVCRVNCSFLDELLRNLKTKGLDEDVFECNPKCILVYAELADDQSINAFELRKEHLEYRNSRYYLNSKNCDYLDAYYISKDDVVRISNSELKSDITLYNKFYLPFSIKRVETESKDKIAFETAASFISDVIKNRKIVSDSNKQELLSVLESLKKDQEFRNTIPFGVSSDKVKGIYELIESYINGEGKEYLFADELVGQILRKSSVIKEQFRKEATAQLKEEIKKLQFDKDYIKAEIEDIEKQKAELQSQIDNLLEKQKSLESFEQEFKNSFTKRVDALKSNVPDALADYCEASCISVGKFM